MTNRAGKRLTPGFTMVEILVAIATVALLLALVFPVINVAKGRANGAKCISNIRSVGQGIMMYTAENGGKYPTFGSDKANAQPYWAERIDSFVGRHSKSYLCPAEKITPDSEEKIAPFNYPGAWYAGIHYGANPAIISMWWGSEQGVDFYVPTGPGMITRPSATVLLTDSWDGRTAPGTGISFVTGHVGEGSRMNPGVWPTSFIKYRHGGKANVCFVDGHIESLTEKQLMPNRDLPLGHPDRSLWDLE